MLRVATVTRPRDLRDQQNGRLRPDLLVDFPEGDWDRGEPLHHYAYYAYIGLRGAAMKEGIQLGMTDGYRNYAKQEFIFTSRYTTDVRQALRNRDGSVVDSKLWKGKRWYLAQGATAAVPGTSNHGWGLAADLREYTNGAWRRLSKKTVDWLNPNVVRDFGWSWERQDEPWHIRYTLGVAPPNYPGNGAATSPVSVPTTPQTPTTPTAPPPTPPRHTVHDIGDVMLYIHTPTPRIGAPNNLDFAFLPAHEEKDGVRMHTQIVVRSRDGAGHLFKLWSSGYGLLPIIEEGPFEATADGRPAVLDVKQSGFVTVELDRWPQGTWEVYAREAWIRL